MVKFLHLGDVHIGYRQYKLLEREQDFFKALLNVCQKGAIDEAVDFVLICGDLFNYRNISPQSFNEVTYVLNQLKKHDIPVIAIEGNHDFKEAGTFNNLRGSWYEALAQNKLMYFLNPHNNEESPLEALIPGQKYLGGGFIDLPCKNKLIRIVGSRWQGFNAGVALPIYANRINQLSQSLPADFTIFMFHAGHEQYLPVNRGGVSAVDFKVLEDIVDYVALGHIHEHYIFKDAAGKDFILNPGSTEANCSSEIDIPRGGLLIEIDEDNCFKQRLIQDYQQREFIKLPKFQANLFDGFADLIKEVEAESLKALIGKVEKGNKLNGQNPIIIAVVDGYCRFSKDNSLLEETKKKIENAGALHFLFQWNVQHYQEGDSLSNSPLNQVNKKDHEKSLLEEILLQSESIANPEQFANEMLELKELIIDRSASADEVFNALSNQASI